MLVSVVVHVEAMSGSGIGHAAAALGLSPHALRMWRDRLATKWTGDPCFIASSERPGSSVRRYVEKYHGRSPGFILGIRQFALSPSEKYNFVSPNEDRKRESAAINGASEPKLSASEILYISVPTAWAPKPKRQAPQISPVTLKKKTTRRYAICVSK